MYRVRLFARFLFALCGLGIAFAATNELYRVSVLAGAADVLSPDRSPVGGELLRFVGWTIVGLGVAAAALVMPRPKLAAGLFVGAAAIAMVGGWFGPWNNLLLDGCAFYVLAVLTAWVRTPARIVVG